MNTTREFLPRKAVITALARAAGGSGRYRLAALEAAGKLRREYPFGIKHARYRSAELKQVIDGLSPASS